MRYVATVIIEVEAESPTKAADRIEDALGPDAGGDWVWDYAKYGMPTHGVPWTTGED